jgi:hypothetical protein
VEETCRKYASAQTNQSHFPTQASSRVSLEFWSLDGGRLSQCERGTDGRLVLCSRLYKSSWAFDSIFRRGKELNFCVYKPLVSDRLTALLFSDDLYCLYVMGCIVPYKYTPFLPTPALAPRFQSIASVHVPCLGNLRD